MHRGAFFSGERAHFSENWGAIFSNMHIFYVNIKECNRITPNVSMCLVVFSSEVN